MAQEVEIKLKISDPADVRPRLAQLAARLHSAALETNRILDTADHRLRDADSALRIRQVALLTPSDPHGRPPTEALLTFKGPATHTAVRSRVEHETRVSDAAVLLEILRAVGFVEQIVYEKKRETWMLDDCEVALDELPSLGWFVEIEGPGEAAIQRVRTRLGLESADPIRESYVHLAARHGRLTPAGTRELRFR